MSVAYILKCADSSHIAYYRELSDTVSTVSELSIYLFWIIWRPIPLHFIVALFLLFFPLLHSENA